MVNLTAAPSIIFCKELIEDRETGLQTYVSSFSKLKLPKDLLAARGISFTAVVIGVPTGVSTEAAWKIFAQDQEVFSTRFPIQIDGDRGNFALNIVGAPIKQAAKCRVELTLDDTSGYFGEFEIEEI